MCFLEGCAGRKSRGVAFGTHYPGVKSALDGENCIHTHAIKGIRACFRFVQTLLSILNTLDFFSRKLEEINPGCVRVRKQGCPLVSFCDSLKKPPLALNGFSAIIATIPPVLLFIPTWHAFAGATAVHVHILVLVKASLRSTVLYKCCSNREGPGKDGILKRKGFFAASVSFLPVTTFL